MTVQPSNESLYIDRASCTIFFGKSNGNDDFLPIVVKEERGKRIAGRLFSKKNDICSEGKTYQRVSVSLSKSARIAQHSIDDLQETARAILDDSHSYALFSKCIENLNEKIGKHNATIKRSLVLRTADRIMRWFTRGRHALSITPVRFVYTGQHVATTAKDQPTSTQVGDQSLVQEASKNRGLPQSPASVEKQTQSNSVAATIDLSASVVERADMSSQKDSSRCGADPQDEPSELPVLTNVKPESKCPPLIFPAITPEKEKLGETEPSLEIEDVCGQEAVAHDADKLLTPVQTWFREFGDGSDFITYLLPRKRKARSSMLNYKQVISFEASLRKWFSNEGKEELNKIRTIIGRSENLKNALTPLVSYSSQEEVRKSLETCGSLPRDLTKKREGANSSATALSMLTKKKVYGESDVVKDEVSLFMKHVRERFPLAGMIEEGDESYYIAIALQVLREESEPDYNIDSFFARTYAQCRSFSKYVDTPRMYTMFEQHRALALGINTSKKPLLTYHKITVTKNGIPRGFNPRYDVLVIRSNGSDVIQRRFAHSDQEIAILDPAHNNGTLCSLDLARRDTLIIGPRNIMKRYAAIDGITILPTEDIVEGSALSCQERQKLQSILNIQHG